MDRHEEAVLDYITADRLRFVSPQFFVPYEMNQGGSCPDFLVLDFGKKTVYIVEVTAASSLADMYSKVEERQTRWLEPIKKHLNSIDTDFGNWRYRVSVFVREENLDAAKRRIGTGGDVSVLTIESVTFSYKWNWNGQVPVNPLE